MTGHRARWPSVSIVAAVAHEVPVHAAAGHRGSRAVREGAIAATGRYAQPGRAAQNLADIAAMGAVPTALLLGLVAPPICR
ncbi:hypothetical protein SANTM175S_00892 [Streptomyces antimycoticus]